MTTPPNEPATPGTDRLFETGCSFCGANRWRPGSVCLVNAHYSGEFRYCGPCYEKHGGHNGMLSEYARRKSAPSPAFVPAVHDLVAAVSVTGSYIGSGVAITGRYSRDCTNGNAMVKPEGKDAVLCLRSSLKPAPAPVVKVPAGTRFGYGGFPDDDPFEFIEEARLRDGKWHGRHAWVSGGRMVEQTERALDCANVRILPRPSQKAVPAQAGLVGPSGQTNVRSTESPEPGQSPADPYAGYDLNAWGISSGSEREKRLERVREILTCTHQQAVCEDTCRLCGATGQERVAMTKRREAAGAFGKPLDRRIASARHATEREAGVKRFDAWVSVRHAREAK